MNSSHYYQPQKPARQLICVHLFILFYLLRILLVDFHLQFDRSRWINAVCKLTWLVATIISQTVEYNETETVELNEVQVQLHAISLCTYELC